MSDSRPPRVTWDQVAVRPTVQLKYGIQRQLHHLDQERTSERGELVYAGGGVRLSGSWNNSPGFGSLLALELTNTSEESIRVARVTFPTENGLDAFLSVFEPENISFLRNGYQSWSTARSYRLRDKPLRPWLRFVSLASSNMANLPSNTAGILSSEMYSVVTDLATGDSFLVGQTAPFDQFVYIRANVQSGRGREPHAQSRPSTFEIVFDFGRKLVQPGETVRLDGLLMAKGDSVELQRQYFEYIRRGASVRIPQRNLTGWSSWYFYYNKITPEDILKNLAVLHERQVSLDFVQIDDGYQTRVGDWLSLTPAFKNRMAGISDAIRAAGYRPGLWLAPFIAERKSQLAQIHPEYVLRNEYGRPITAGYNMFWHSHWYYGLDITNLRFEEYLRKVVRTITNTWGYELLKCDFLFAGCLRGGTHNDLTLSRPEVLKRGMQIIREEAGPATFIIGCGMPLSAGIGLVDSMRVGTDTGPYWKEMGGRFLNTATMVGVRNSIRNLMVRSPMHKRLWLNDPDCCMIRSERTRLSARERASQINAIVLSGGPLLFSDDLSRLPPERFDDIARISALSARCFEGWPIAIDVMEGELPTLFYNTAGYLGVFNTGDHSTSRTVDFARLPLGGARVRAVEDAWTAEVIEVTPGSPLVLRRMPGHSSRLFKLLTD
jgi:alpha-galactosidase